jgi:hypothetical protein
MGKTIPTFNPSTEDGSSTGPRRTWLLGLLAKPWVLPVVCGVGLVVIYNVTAVSNRSEADDAFWFAYEVEHASYRQLVGPDHTRHLLFLPVFREFHTLLQRVGLEFRAYDEMRFASTIFAALAVLLMFIVLRNRLELSRFAAATGAIGLAASYGFWRYANEAEVYSLAVLLVLIICWLGFAQDHSIRSWVAVGGIAALTVLVDAQILGTAVIAVGAALLVKRRLRELAAYTLTLVGSLLGATLALYWYADPPGRHYFSYLLGGTGSETSGIAGSYNAGTLPKSMIGLGQDVTAGTFLVSYQAVAQRLRTAFPDKTSDLLYAAERTDMVARILPPILLVLLGTLTIWLILAVRSRRSELADPRLVAGVAAWFVALFIVLAGRDPIAPEAWTLILPALWMIVASLLFERAHGPGARRLVVAVLAFLVALNFLGGIWIMGNKAGDYNWQRARWLLAHAHSEDVILTADSSKFFRYLRYYSRADVQCLQGLSINQLQRLYESEVEQADHLYVTADVLRPPRFLALKRPEDYEVLMRFSNSAGQEFKKVAHDEFGGVYVDVKGRHGGTTSLQPTSDHSC